MTNDKIDAAIREVTAIVPDSRDRAIYLAGYEAGASEYEGVTAPWLDGGTQ